MTPNQFSAGWNKITYPIRIITCKDGIVAYSNDYTVIVENNTQIVVLRYMLFYSGVSITVANIPVAEIIKVS